MAYRLASSDPSVECAIRRIATEQIAAAVQAIEDPAVESGSAVHEVRKACKKLRGVLRLVRCEFKNYAAENAAFRDIAAQSSGLRDADILIATHEALVTRYAAQVDRRSLAPIRRRLTLRRNACAAAQDPTALLSSCRSDLLAAAERAGHWRLQAEGFDALQGGLRKTFARARKCMHEARESPSAGNLHEWRKHCKHHWYHARLLGPIWPGPMRAHAQCAGELGEALGEHHDLAVFMQVISADDGAFGKPAPVEVMAGLARARQVSLETEAFALGERLLAQSPAALSRSWGRRFEAWQDS